jgi:hypothetical protein
VGELLLVRQPAPLARHVYQGIAGRPGWNLVGKFRTISRKLPILVCPTRQAAVRWSITNERYRQRVIPINLVFSRSVFLPKNAIARMLLEVPRAANDIKAI